MANYTENLGVQLLDPGQANAHIIVNEALVNMDKAIAGKLTLALTGGVRNLTGAESTNAIIHVTSATAGTMIVVQNKQKSWIVINDGTNDVSVSVAGQATPPVAVWGGDVGVFVCDGAGKVRRSRFPAP